MDGLTDDGCHLVGIVPNVKNEKTFHGYRTGTVSVALNTWKLG